MFNSLLIFSAENEKNDSLNNYFQNSFFIEYLGKGPISLNYQLIYLNNKIDKSIDKELDHYGLNFAYSYFPTPRNSTAHLFYISLTNELKQEDRKIIKNYGVALLYTDYFNGKFTNIPLILPYYSFHKRFNFKNDKGFIQYGVNITFLICLINVGIGFDI